MDRLTFAAERTGAVNTVIGNAGHLVGDNTDLYGFAEALRRFGAVRRRRGRPSWCWAPAAPLARSYTPCSTAGRAASRWPTEPSTRGHELIRGHPAARRNASGQRLRPRRRPPAHRDLAAAQLLVNTTSVGMAGGPAPAETCPVSRRMAARQPLRLRHRLPPRLDAAAGRRASAAAPSHPRRPRNARHAGCRQPRTMDRPPGPGAYHAGGRPGRAGRRPTQDLRLNQWETSAT